MNIEKITTMLHYGLIVIASIIVAILVMGTIYFSFTMMIYSIDAFKDEMYVTGIVLFVMFLLGLAVLMIIALSLTDLIWN